MMTSEENAKSTGLNVFRRTFRRLSERLKTRKAKIGCLVAIFVAMTGFLLVGLPILIFTGLVINGFVHAGKWDDDPKNWERAFGAPVPKDVLIIHSAYLRTPHFTREEEFSFQFKAPPGYVTDWVTHEKMRESALNDEKQIQELKARRPKWFLPKPPAAYQGWSFPDEPHSNFRLFVDRETGDIFYTDSQM